MDILSIIFLVIILSVSIGMHEYAHAYVSYFFGDPTPKLQHRLTPNPLAHLDPIGFILIFFIGFGWGKPVQVNPLYYKNPIRDELLVALAWPLTNIILAFFGVIVILLYAKFGLSLSQPAQIYQTSDLVIQFWILFSSINITLAIFNMIPLPPLDGFRIVKIINYSFALWIEQYSLYISLAFLGLVVLGPFQYILHTYIQSVGNAIFSFIVMIVSQIIY